MDHDLLSFTGLGSDQCKLSCRKATLSGCYCLVERFSNHRVLLYGLGMKCWITFTTVNKHILCMLGFGEIKQNERFSFSHKDMSYGYVV